MICPFFTIELKSAYSSEHGPRHLRADVHGLDRFQRAGGADGVDDVAARDLQRRDGRLRRAPCVM